MMIKPINMLLKNVTFFVFFSILIFLLVNPVKASNSFESKLSPAMGWNGWNHFRCSEELNETSFIQIVDKIVSSGLKDAGYEYVNLDDCWQISRSKKGALEADKTRFPHGIKFLSDYVHSKGLKFGIYTSAGTKTCEGRPGSFGFEQQDLELFQSWEVDYIKVDWCNADYLDPLVQFLKWETYISNLQRPIKYSVAIGPAEQNQPWLWGAQVSDSWRVARDINDDWSDMLRVHDEDIKLTEYTKLGHWNDSDMLQVGNGGMSYKENSTHFKLWAFMNSPLILGNDVRLMSPQILKIVSNKDLISLDQDLQYSKPKIITQTENVEVLGKAKENGERVVLLLNKSSIPQMISVQAKDLGLLGIAKIKGITSYSPANFYSSIIDWIPSHSASIISINGIQNSFPFNSQNEITSPPKTHTGFLSDQGWFQEENGHGPVLKDRLIGTEGEADGVPITVFPHQTFQKGLGVHAYSRIVLFLDKSCKTFSTIAALPDYLPKEISIGFSVNVDGQSVFNKILDNKHSSENIQVDLTNKKFLILEVYPPNEKTVDFEHAVWANPYISCSEN